MIRTAILPRSDRVSPTPLLAASATALPLLPTIRQITHPGCNGGSQAEGGSMAKKYRVAVIGRTGKGNYGHGLDVVWKALDNVEIVAVADENDKGRASAAKRLGAPNAYADYRQMLE